ncbi:hypothetical protein FHR32_007868 [Streptosporangium album]|uniref:Uncharacterized protein n=1 Tax=Streptosporangium album TaxID=47479 RepID=A0A7W7WE26_9ACTN|nr:hypothetical protein [Streptosporangium album]
MRHKLGVLRAHRERLGRLYSKRTMAADYRASAAVDVEHDQADRQAGNRLRMPVTALQQDWGAALGFDASPCGRHGPPTWNTSASPAATSWPKKPPPMSSRHCATSWPGRACRPAQPPALIGGEEVPVGPGVEAVVGIGEGAGQLIAPSSSR